MNHDVVLIDWAARAARRLDILAGEQGYYFPARTLGGQRTKNPYSDPGFINHALQYMPGVDMSCHSWRRGFASHGQRELGFSLEDIKLILDHSEGAPAGDVTAGHYALDPMIEETASTSAAGEKSIVSNSKRPASSFDRSRISLRIRCRLSPDSRMVATA